MRPVGIDRHDIIGCSEISLVTRVYRISTSAILTPLSGGGHDMKDQKSLRKVGEHK